MYPSLVSFFGIDISSFGLFAIASALVFFWFTNKMAKRLSLDNGIIKKHFLWVLFASLIIARLFYFWKNDIPFTSQAGSYLHLFSFWDHRLSEPIFLIAFGIILILLLQIYREDILSWLDAFAYGFFPAFFLYTIGEFLGWFGFGMPAVNSTFGVTLNNPDFAYSGISLHPLQLYYASIAFVLTILTHSLLRGKEGNFSTILPAQGLIFFFSFAMFFLVSGYLQSFAAGGSELFGLKQNIFIHFGLFVAFFLGYLYLKFILRRRRVHRVIE